MADGVLLIDKPTGWTSHDVVARLRRILGTRQVGHAGTLDPLASGLLVLGVGQGTKLLNHLQNDNKEYEVTVELGEQTDTLDREGQVVRRAAVPADLSVALVQAVAEKFLGNHLQAVPAFSAVKVEGTPLHRLARRGAVIDAPTREVQLQSVAVSGVAGARLDLALRCAKGFYVRSFARDLAIALGSVGHVTKLRRTKSGAFHVEEAVPPDVLDSALEISRPQCAAALLSFKEACRGIGCVVLNSQGQSDAQHGRLIARESIVMDSAGQDDAAIVACYNEDFELLALAIRDTDGLRVKRGFSPAPHVIDKSAAYC